MRKVVVQEFVTIDGFAAGQQDELDFMPQEFSTGTKNSIENNQLQFIKTIDTMILGRNTYRMFEAYWPNATDRIALSIHCMSKCFK